jgi:hypothetical protein
VSRRHLTERYILAGVTRTEESTGNKGMVVSARPEGHTEQFVCIFGAKMQPRDMGKLAFQEDPFGCS